MISQCRLAITGSRESRGGRAILEASPFPTPSARAGKTSPIIFKYRICSGRIGSGAPISSAKVTIMISPMLPDSKKMMNFRILSKMARPWDMATTMLRKASSLRTMSEASRATWVPRCPMETPISAFFNAGASLTPSPVMATTAPFCWCRSIRSSFCSGVTRANKEESNNRRCSFFETSESGLRSFP